MAAYNLPTEEEEIAIYCEEIKEIYDTSLSLNNSNLDLMNELTNRYDLDRIIKGAREQGHFKDEFINYLLRICEENDQIQMAKLWENIETECIKPVNATRAAMWYWRYFLFDFFIISNRQ